MTQVDLEGLRRKDAVILMGLVLRERGREREPPRPLWKRLWFVMRRRLRRRLRRLERRGLIEPGRRLEPFRYPPLNCKATPLGVVTAQAALITLGLEDGHRHFDG